MHAMGLFGPIYLGSVLGLPVKLVFPDPFFHKLTSCLCCTVITVKVISGVLVFKGSVVTECITCTYTLATISGQTISELLARNFKYYDEALAIASAFTRLQHIRSA